MTQKNSNKVITRKDLVRTFLRSLPLEWSFNYVKQQNLGFIYGILPIIDKLYKNKEDRKEAYERHLEFFNITPYLSTIPMGITLALEEVRAEDKSKMDANVINNLKIAMMGPLSGIGDSFFWGTLRVIATAIAIPLAKEGNILGPILFLLAFNIPALLIRWFGLIYSYKLGETFVAKLQNNVMQKLTFGASIVGLCVIGAMAGSWVTLNVPLLIGSGEGAQTISQLADSIVPNILPLLSVFGCFYLVKKNIKSQYVLLLIGLIGIVGAFLGFLGV